MTSTGLRLAACALPVALLAGCGKTTTTVEKVTVTVTAPATPSADLGPSRERVEFGHIESLVREGDHFALRFDPAWYLSGVAANEAAAEDGAVEPGEPVPNDNYVVEEGHRLLSFVVAADAKVSVLTRGGDPAQLGKTPTSVAELARIVAGTSSLDLFEPLDSGVWITVDIGTVRAIDQQYRP